MTSILSETETLEKSEQDKPLWALHKVAKVKFYSNKKLAKVYLINAFERHDKITFNFVQLEKRHLSRACSGFAVIDCYILKVRRRKDGTPFFCFYRKATHANSAYVRSCDPGILFDKMREMHYQIFKGPQTCDEDRKQFLEKIKNRKKEMPAVWSKKVLRLLRDLCRRNAVSTKYLHKQPLAAMRQLLYPKGTELFSETELLMIKVNPFLNGCIAKNVFGSQGKKSKVLAKKICFLEGSKDILCIVRSVRVYHGIDRAQTVAEAFLCAKEALFKSFDIILKFPEEKEPVKFKYTVQMIAPFNAKYIRACRHYTYKEFLKMLFAEPHYRMDVERNLEEYGVPAAEAHKTFVELHDHMAKVKAMDGDDYGKPIPRPVIADNIEKYFALLSNGLYSVEFPDNTARIHEYGTWGSNCIYGYARGVIKERSLVLAVLDKSGNLNTLFGFNYRPRYNDSSKGYVSHRDSSQRFNKVQNAKEFKSIREWVFEAIETACSIHGQFQWDKPAHLMSYDEQIDFVPEDA